MEAPEVNSVLTSLELAHLAEVREVTVTVNTAGWHRILKQIEEFVEEAHEDIFRNVSPNPQNAQLLQIRWQQREAVLRGIQHFVGSCQSEREQLLSEAKERSVPLESYNAEQDREA